MLNHLEACGHCPKYVRGATQKEHTGCELYADVTWVNRRGGCPHFSYVELPVGMSYLDGKIMRKGRSGQQKQAHTDRKYDSKNDRRGKFRRVIE